MNLLFVLSSDGNNLDEEIIGCKKLSGKRYKNPDTVSVKICAKQALLKNTDKLKGQILGQKNPTDLRIRCTDVPAEGTPVHPFLKFTQIYTFFFFVIINQDNALQTAAKGITATTLLLPVVGISV